MLSVTFDTNVWNRMVLPERWVSHPKYGSFLKIRDAVRSGRIGGFISEGFATAEAIGKKNQARYYVQSVPGVQVHSTAPSGGSISISIDIQPKHDQHPGIGKDFEEELSAGLAIGLKLLTTPYIGLAVPDRLRNNPQIYAPEVFATADYNERFGEVVRAINERAVGEGALGALAERFTAELDSPRPPERSDREFIYRVYEYACSAGRTIERLRIEKAFAESADGDLVAAHIAFGNDYLCTEDQAKAALSGSIFDTKNRAWLKSQYGTVVVGVEELASLLD